MDCSRDHNRNRMRRVRQDPEGRARVNAASRRHKAKRKADPTLHAQDLENMRIQHRLRQERKGRSLDTIRPKRATMGLDPTAQIMLPARPLVEAVAVLAEQRGATETTMCAALGINPKQLYDWREGVWEHVTLPVADRVVTRAGLMLEDVWPESALASVR
jgi:hypothetical protein